MNLIEELRHLRIKCRTVSVKIDIVLFYFVASVIIMTLIGVKIPDGSNGFSREKVFEEEKLAKVSDISCVAVLQRGATSKS